MSEHRATINWKKTSASFDYKEYNREHTWTFENGLVVEASAAPKFLGKEEFVDPEEAFVASLSACHMLTFIAICSRQGITVESYVDRAVGFLEPNDNRKLAITRIELHPEVRFAGGDEPSADALAEIHSKAHHNCFLANSVTTEITVE